MATSYVQITLADHLDARSAVRLGLPSQEFRPGDQIIVLADDARSLSAAGYVAVASVISAVPLLGGPNVWTGTQSFTGATITGLAGQADLIGTYAAKALGTSIALYRNERWAYSDAFAAPPTADVPTITYDASNLAGATLVTPKRVGAAGTALDSAGDTHFRYLGFPASAGIAVAADATNFVMADLKPGGSTQAAYWPFAVEFETTADIVQLRQRASQTNDPLGIILVNGRWVSESAQIGTATAGNWNRIRLTFPSTGPRRITFIGLGSAGGFGGVMVTAGHSIIRPTNTIKRRVAVIGDSYVNGAGTAPTGALNTETWALRLAYLLGADEVILAGIGSTGWVTQAGGDATSPFGNRVSAVLGMSPHAVIFAGSRNDAGQSSAAITAAVTSAVSACSAIPEVYVSGPQQAGFEAVNAAVKAGAAAAGRPFIDLCGSIYGTGWVGGETHDGNADFYIGTAGGNGIHPVQEGHRYLTKRYFTALAAQYGMS